MHLVGMSHWHQKVKQMFHLTSRSLNSQVKAEKEDLSNVTIEELQEKTIKVVTASMLLMEFSTLKKGIIKSRPNCRNVSELTNYLFSQLKSVLLRL